VAAGKFRYHASLPEFSKRVSHRPASASREHRTDWRITNAKRMARGTCDIPENVTLQPASLGERIEIKSCLKNCGIW